MSQDNNLETKMEKVKITNCYGENSNPNEQSNEVNENNNGNRTLLSKWHNEILAFAAIGTLIVTGALAIITYCSLREVKKQRDLTYKQFVLANRPNVNIAFEGGGLRLGKKVAYIDWILSNNGGDVKDLLF